MNNCILRIYLRHHHFSAIALDKQSSNPRRWRKLFETASTKLIVNYLKKYETVFFFYFLDKPENLQLKTSAVDSKACKGESISINCSADAVPPVTSYELLENGSVILDISGMWSRTLSSRGVFIYKCVANNSLGSTESESVTVTVNGKQSYIFTSGYCVESFEMTCIS